MLENRVLAEIGRKLQGGRADMGKKLWAKNFSGAYPQSSGKRSWRYYSGTIEPKGVTEGGGIGFESKPWPLMIKTYILCYPGCGIGGMGGSKGAMAGI